MRLMASCGKDTIEFRDTLHMTKNILMVYSTSVSLVVCLELAPGLNDVSPSLRQPRANWQIAGGGAVGATWMLQTFLTAFSSALSSSRTSWPRCERRRRLVDLTDFAFLSAFHSYSFICCFSGNAKLEPFTTSSLLVEIM